MWSLKPAQFTLAEGEVHIWRAYLNCEEKTLQQFETTLSPEEIARANRFLSSRDRNSFVSTRGILRELLGKYTNCRAADVAITYGNYGKPSLCSTNPKQSVQFNISHSHGLVLLAFAIDRVLGVDLELVREGFVGEEIAERYFSSQEVNELKALPPHLRTEGFFLCWTRKEAYVKARGKGLEIPLKSFSVSLTPGQPEHLWSEDQSRWCLHSLCPGARYVGAFVAEGKEAQIRSLDWKP